MVAFVVICYVIDEEIAKLTKSLKGKFVVNDSIVVSIFVSHNRSEAPRSMQ